jgi:phosphate transport system substrate-binding protein
MRQVLAPYAGLCLLALHPSGAHALEISGAGSAQQAPLMLGWAAQFRATAKVDVKYQAVGSGGGLRQLQDGAADFAVVDWPLSAREMARAGVAQQIPISTQTVAIVVNLPEMKQQKPPLRLSGAVLAEIYAGRITRWDDRRLRVLNPQVLLPPRRIVPLHRGDGAGVTWTVTQFLAASSAHWKREVGAGRSVRWPGAPRGRPGDGVASVMRSSPGSIGYVEAHFARQNRMQIALIRNRAGAFVGPSAQNASAALEACAPRLAKNPAAPAADAPGARSYPLCALSFLLVPRRIESAKRAQVARFVRWSGQSQQSKHAAALSYAPLPQLLREKAAREVASLAPRAGASTCASST